MIGLRASRLATARALLFVQTLEGDHGPEKLVGVLFPAKPSGSVPTLPEAALGYVMQADPSQLRLLILHAAARLDVLDGPVVDLADRPEGG